MKILYISPENTVGLLSTWKKVHEKLGNECDFITMYKSKQKFDDGICLNLPFINTTSKYIDFRNQYYKMTRGPLGAQEEIKNSIYNKNNFFESIYFFIRDFVWSFTIEKAIKEYNLMDYDYYHFEWGMDLYRNCKFAKKIKSLGKPIIASYHGQDIRTRGVFQEMDKIVDINITSEIDLLEIYNKLNHLFLPYDVNNQKYNLQVNNTIKICHAPTNRYYKGSEIIIPICKKLADQNNHVEFILIENRKHDEVIKIKRNCDIIVDQIEDRGGWGYGMSSVEAMSMGLCSATEINDCVEKVIPNHPFISINKENCYQQLNELVNNKKLLMEKKQSSYEWVKSYHSLDNVGLKLYELYKQII